MEHSSFIFITPPYFRENVCSTWNNGVYLPKKISRTLMSAGDTPGIRDACPMVVGQIFDNFWRASIVMEVIFIKSKSLGM